MHDPTDHVTTERQQADRPMQSPTQLVPRILAHVSTPFGSRHIRGVALTRWIIAIWLMILGTIFCASGQWWGALLFVAVPVHAWLAYQMPRWRRVLDAARSEQFLR